MGSKRQGLKLRYKQIVSIGLLLAGAAVSGLLLNSSRSTQAAATQFSLSPSSQTVAAGASFTVTVNLTTGGANVDSVQAALSYPSTQLTCTGTGSTSAFSIAPQADSCGGGSVVIQRGRTGSFSSDAAVATITFTALTGGTAPMVSFTGSTVAYSAGNVVASSTSPGTYTISAPPPASSSAPAPSTAPAASSSSGSSSSTGHSSSSTGSTTKSSDSSSSTSSSSVPTAPAAGTAAGPAAPVISNLKVTNVTGTTATVTWDTDQSATSAVGYGLNQSYQLVAAGIGLVNVHSVSLSPSLLQPGLTYYVQVTSANAAGTTATATTSFATSGFSLTVHVTGADGQSLAGATVTLGGQSRTTDSQGNADFTNVPYGQQPVKISYGGSVTKSNVNVGKPAANGKVPTTQNVTLVATTSVVNPQNISLLAGLLILLAAGVALSYRAWLVRLWIRLRPHSTLAASATAPSLQSYDRRSPAPTALPVATPVPGDPPAIPDPVEASSPPADSPPVVSDDDAPSSPPMPGSRIEPQGQADKPEDAS